MRRRPLNLGEILRWADAYRETTGKWPTQASGTIVGTIGETWGGVDGALKLGLRGLSAGSSLTRLLAAERGARNPRDLPPLSEEQILQWADDHYRRTGAWPIAKAGRIPGTHGETWNAIANALASGERGLPGGFSLARLLAERRGRRYQHDLPPLSEEQILTWADAHRALTGGWPTNSSGPVTDGPGETWGAIDGALQKGYRSLPGGSSLAFLLADRREVRNVWSLPNLALEQILTWCDAFQQRTGGWPRPNSGAIPESPSETWKAVAHALRLGTRGLLGGSSLAELLRSERGVRNIQRLPRLTHSLILAWADEHYRRTGTWPTEYSGPVAAAPGEDWFNLSKALRVGRRGLRRGSSLAQLLAAKRGKRNPQDLPRLSRKKILRWADAHFERTGEWPHMGSGPVRDAAGEDWRNIDLALESGNRGLPGGSSVSRLLAAKRGARTRRHAPPLTAEEILRWADLHFQRTGTWPRHTSGPVDGVPGETWSRIHNALRQGKRGLSGDSSLAKFLAEKRGASYWSRRSGQRTVLACESEG